MIDLHEGDAMLEYINWSAFENDFLKETMKFHSHGNLNGFIITMNLTMLTVYWTVEWLYSCFIEKNMPNIELPKDWTRQVI